MLSLFNKDDEVIKSKDGVFDKYHHIIAWIPFVASVFYCTSPLDIVSDILPLSGKNRRRIFISSNDIAWYSKWSFLYLS